MLVPNVDEIGRLFRYTAAATPQEKKYLNFLQTLHDHLEQKSTSTKNAKFLGKPLAEWEKNIIGILEARILRALCDGQFLYGAGVNMNAATLTARLSGFEWPENGYANPQLTAYYTTMKGRKKSDLFVLWAFIKQKLIETQNWTQQEYDDIMNFKRHTESQESKLKAYATTKSNSFFSPGNLITNTQNGILTLDNGDKVFMDSAQSILNSGGKQRQGGNTALLPVRNFVIDDKIGFLPANNESMRAGGNSTAGRPFEELVSHLTVPFKAISSKKIERYGLPEAMSRVAGSTGCVPCGSTSFLPSSSSSSSSSSSVSRHGGAQLLSKIRANPDAYISRFSPHPTSMSSSKNRSDKKKSHSGGRR
jgi:hypothetical protein